jgi:acyl-CoA synthetase (AMP-forming)/AMP-acid ligase II
MENKQVIVGVVAKNSISYVQSIFDCYQNNHIVVLLRDINDSRIALTGVSKVIEPDDNKGWYESSLTFSSDDTLAQIAFTSGTEGEPKGVLLTHGALSDVTQRLNEVMEVDSSIREYVGIPSNYSFGLGRFRAVAAAGGKAYLPENGFNPLEIRQMLQSGTINSISAVPSLWRVLIKNKAIFSDETKKLKWIEIGSQYMSRGEKEDLKSIFPNAVIAQHYGLTEASRTTFLRIDKLIGEELESVGKAYGNTEIKISDSGRICIRGPHVAKTLLKNGDYVSNFDDDGWFHSCDLGRISSGYLYYQGRADDLINCAGIKLSPDAIEKDLRDKLGIKDGFAVCAVNDELTGNAVLVAILATVSIPDEHFRNALNSILINYGLNNKNIIKTLRVDEFPVTGTNKVIRKELSSQYELSCMNSDSMLQSGVDFSVQDLTDEEKKVALIWQDVLKIHVVDIDLNFYDFGGDSLSVISALIDMERKGIPSNISKGMLQGHTIREIAQGLSLPSNDDGKRKHEIKTPEIRTSMTVNMVRGLIVLLVILAHWHQGFIALLPISDPSVITYYLAPLLAFGTPGFAVIYGVGAGYSLFPIFKNDPERLRYILKKTFNFLMMGIILLGSIKFLDKFNTQDSVSFTNFTNSFYSVLTYYLFVTATIYFWFKLLVKQDYPIAYSILVSIVLYSFHMLVVRKFGSYHAEGLVEFTKLIFTAKYAYFLMLSGTMLGISAGIFIGKLKTDHQNLSVFYTIGITAMLSGLAISVHVEDLNSWFIWPIKENYIWRWMTYAGLVLVLIAFFDQILVKYERFHHWQKFIAQSLSIIGMLAFPLFVLHEMVIPMKEIFMANGVSSSISLLISMMMFLGVSYYMFRKLHRFSFL